MAKRVSIKEKIFNFCYRFKYGTVMFLIGFTVIFWDLLSKLITDGKTAEVIKGFVSVESSHNPGGAWSIMGEHPALLIILSTAFIVFLLLGNWFFEEKNYFYAISMGLVISGALGNLYDRIMYGKVRDFIKLEFIDFPTFNLADCAITIGITLLIIYFIFVVPYYIKKKEKLELAKQQEIADVKTDTIDENEEFSQEIVTSEINSELESSEEESDLQTAEINIIESSAIEDIQEQQNNENIETTSSRIKRNRRTKLGSNRKNVNYDSSVRKNRRKENAIESLNKNSKTKKQPELENKIEEVVKVKDVQVEEVVEQQNITEEKPKQVKKSTNSKPKTSKKEVEVLSTETPVKKTTRKKVEGETKKTTKTSTSKKVKEESSQNKTTKSGELKKTTKTSGTEKKTTPKKSTTKKTEKTESENKLATTKSETKKPTERKTTRAKKETNKVDGEIKPKTRTGAKTKKEVKDE